MSPGMKPRISGKQIYDRDRFIPIIEELTVIKKCPTEAKYSFCGALCIVA